jgi:hypothetical protein
MDNVSERPMRRRFRFLLVLDLMAESPDALKKKKRKKRRHSFGPSDVQLGRNLGDDLFARTDSQWKGTENTGLILRQQARTMLTAATGSPQTAVGLEEAIWRAWFVFQPSR